MLHQCCCESTQSFHLVISPVSPTPVFTFCENTIFPSSHQSCESYISVHILWKYPIFPSSHQSCECYISVHILWKYPIFPSSHQSCRCYISVHILWKYPIFPSSHQSCRCYISVVVKVPNLSIQSSVLHVLHQCSCESTLSLHPVISPAGATSVLLWKYPIFPSSHQSCRCYISVLVKVPYLSIQSSVLWVLHQCSHFVKAHNPASCTSNKQ